MVEWKTTLTELFPNLKFYLHRETTSLTEMIQVNGVRQEKKYNVNFKSRGICLHKFDKVAPGILGTRKCFDVLSASETMINYIELKSTFGPSELRDLGNKFYYGNLKAAHVLALIPTRDCSYNYIIIYEKDVLEDVMKTRELIGQKISNNHKDDIHAWYEGVVVLK